MMKFQEFFRELSEITENGMTGAQELEILDSDRNDPVYGPFESLEALMEALNKEE